MSDLISRQEALEAIQDAHHHVEVMSMIDHGRLSGLGQASNIVRDLPSVCTDCIKHGGDWECDHVNCHKGKDVPDIFDKDSLIDVLEKCGILWSDKLEKVITVKALALFYGEKYETLQKKMERFAIDLFEDIREINKNDELFDRLKRNGIISNKAPKITVVSPSGVAKIAYFSEGVKQYEVRHALNEIDHRLHKELSVKYSDIYFSKIYQKEMSYLVNNIFRFHKVENEKYVEGYRIDFLIDNHIAIECDESVHDYYNKEHEESRKKLMETKGYTFYRYDVRKGNMLSFIGNLIDKEWIRPNVGDIISRKQAIEAMGEEPMVWNDDDAFALGERNQWERDVEAIKGVPSAEPEPSRDVVDRATMLETYADLYDMFDSYPNICNNIHVVYDKLRNLPSVKPDSKELSSTHKALDTISRQVAIVQLSHNKTGDDDCDVVIQNDIETIKALPSAEPERKIGSWIEFPNHMAYKCSECGRIIQTTDGRRNVSKNYPFCHCGAYMRGEEDG